MTALTRALNGIPVFIAGFVLAALLWPIAYALWMSFTPKELLQPPTDEWSLRWYREFFSRQQWMDGVVNTLIVAGLATVIAVVCGTSVATAVAHYRFRGRALLELAVILPLFVPALVIGMSLLPMMRTIGLWGTHLSVAVAHSLWGLPLVFIVVRNALVEVDPNLDAAARGLGASPWQTYRYVTLPIIAPAISLGAVLTLIVSINELIMALFLCTAANETLPKVVWPSLRYTLSPLTAAASGVTVLITLLLLGAGWWMYWLRQSK